MRTTFVRTLSFVCLCDGVHYDDEGPSCRSKSSIALGVERQAFAYASLLFSPYFFQASKRVPGIFPFPLFVQFCYSMVYGWLHKLHTTVYKKAYDNALVATVRKTQKALFFYFCRLSDLDSLYVAQKKNALFDARLFF